MEEKLPSKPRQLWDQAVRAVKGDQPQALVEQFTAQMTLVAQGLVDDQSRLHRDLEKLEVKQDQDRHRLEEGQELLTRELDAREHTLTERMDKQRTDTEQKFDRQLGDMLRHMDELSGKVNRLSDELKEMKSDMDKRAAQQKKKKGQTLVQQLTLPIALVCITIVVVAVLRLLR